MICALTEKVDASNGSTEGKQALRGLLQSIRAQPALADTVSKIVDGDGTAAATALEPAGVRESAEGCFAKGAAFAMRLEWCDAINAYREAVEKDATISGAWFSLGYAEYCKNKNSSCEAMFMPLSHCIELVPNHVVANTTLGVVLKDSRKEYDEAERTLRRAIKIDRNHALAHLNLGDLLQDVRHDYDGAEQSYRKAIEIDPTFARAYNKLGILLQFVRLDYNGAERAFEKAIQLKPNNVDALPTSFG